LFVWPWILPWIFPKIRNRGEIQNQQTYLEGNKND
jgi:hypothetical protein